MKHIGKLAILGAVIAASAPFAFADTIGSYASGSAMGNINTPLNYAGYTIGNYTGNLSDFVQNPSTYIQGGTAPAVNIGAGAPWLDALPNSSWVSYIAGTNPASPGSPTFVAPNGYYTFTTNFGVSSNGLYSISLDLLADDTLAVYLNGVNKVLAGPIGSDAECSDNGVRCAVLTNDTFSAALTGGVNNNTLTFVVEQTGSHDFGLDFTGTVSQTPEPSSLMLLGSGLVGAAGMFFRRRAVA